MVVVVDTSVFVAALIGPKGASRAVLRACFKHRLRPLMGAALLAEYESLLSREEVFKRSPLSHEDRDLLFDAFLSVCGWTRVYFLWRPNLPDEADNHLIELAVAGGAQAIITKNVKDFRRSELQFPEVRILRPEDIAQEID